MLAVTARSEVVPENEINEAVSLAEKIGARHIIYDLKLLDVPGFSANPPERCFICKNKIFSEIKNIAKKKKISIVFDGSNTDDADDFRPGRVAARRLGIRSPLEEARLDKDEIRLLSRSLNLSTWNKPPSVCLASRFPYHSKITNKALKQVEKAEKYLMELGMHIFRVRHHDSIARIEVGKKEKSLFEKSDLCKKVAVRFKDLGYSFVCLDLEEYQTGRMNANLTNKDLSI